MSWEHCYKEFLNYRHETQKYRQLPAFFDAPNAPKSLKISARTANISNTKSSGVHPFAQDVCHRVARGAHGERASNIDVSHNDYLGLSMHPSVIDAGIQAIKGYGAGARGSRLLCGTSSLAHALEARIAHDKKRPCALIFNSGFQANTTVLAALLSKKVLSKTPVVFLDKLCHSSMYEGVQASKARLVRFRHNDANHLEAQMHKHLGKGDTPFILTESVFGMDGDTAPFEDIIDLAKRFHALIYMDEAHSVGLFGAHGYGHGSSLDFQGVPHILMGTLSKAIGGSGGYVACDFIIKDYLVNACAGFIYTTAPAPAVMGAALCAWDLIKHYDCVRHQMMSRAQRLRTALKGMGFNTGASASHILPIIFPSIEEAVKMHHELDAHGIITSCIRPPTVPYPRLRLAINSHITDEDIAHIIAVLSKC